MRIMRLLRNAAFFLAAAIAVLACVLGGNALMRTSRQIAVAPLPRVAVDQDAVAKRLAEAIRFPTISNFLDPEHSAGAFRGLHAFMQTSYPAFHAAAKREVIGNFGLLYAWEGTDPKAAPIALLAHQDVVPIAPGTEDQWQAPPFDGVIRDGFVWGRGSWDNKGNLVAILEAAEQLAKEGFRPKRTIYFVFGQDEEVGGQRGAKQIAALFASRGIRLDFILDEGLLITEGILKGIDRPVALIGVAEKGYVTLTLNLNAAPGHSSMPPRQSAIGMMSAALARLEDRQFPAEIRGTVREMFDTLAPEMNLTNRIVLSNLWLLKPVLQRELEKMPSANATIRTTTALTIFNAGNQDNVLPGRADATLNFRLVPGDTEASVLDHVKRAAASDKIEIAPRAGNTEPPPVTSTASPSYRALNTTIREIFPDVVVAPGLMIAATDSRHLAGVTDNIFRFSPVRATAEDLTRFHGTNERLSVANYGDMIRFYRRLVQNTASP